MPIRLVAKTFPIVAADHTVVIRRLNTRQFKTFVLAAQEFSAASGSEIFDKLVELLSSVIVKFKEDYTDEEDNPLDTVEDILWALEMSVLNEMCSAVIKAVKLGDRESKNSSSSPEQPTVESGESVETDVSKEKELASSIPEKTGQ